MEHLYEYKKYAILYVDDEEKSLKYFTRAFEDQFRIFTAPNAQEGLKLLEEHKDDLGLLMTDQRMPGEKGVWLLEKARQLRPRIIRILATAYSDMDAAIAAVNTGAIYKYVQGQIGKINNMLKDLWTASEQPAFAFGDQVQLRQVVTDAVAQLKDNFAAKNIQVENGIPESLPALNVDKPKFYRLFDLLLKDEIASLPPGSRITFSASLRNGVRADQQEIEIQVSDNGPGLPKEALRLVFDPFVVRSDSPVEYGIHLMACYFIVHHHSGRINAHSEEGQGTTFTMRLPTNPNQAPSSQHEQEFLQKVLLNETIWEKLISSE